MIPMLFPHRHPQQPPRVVVTGAGIITSLGLGWDRNAEGFQSGKSEFLPVSSFDVSRQKVKLAAQVSLPPSIPTGLLTPRQSSRVDRATSMLLLTAHEAWTQAGWAGDTSVPVILGTTAGGMALGESYFRQAVTTPDHHALQATRALQYQAHNQVRMVSDALGTDGAVRIISNACASGTDAIGNAWEWIRRGHGERVLTGGYDALSEMVFTGFGSLQLMSTTTCRPFDASRDGLMLGEGSAVLALESLDFARRRNATILGEILGYGTAIDRHHLTQPHPQGDAALAAMCGACDSARVTSADIDYVNAHGTGTLLNDSSEAIATGRWAGARAATLPVSSSKACIGHLLGAAGAVEAVICLMALKGQWLPPQPNFERPDATCTFPVVSKPQSARVDTILSNSFGFGGVNASLVLRRWA